MKAEIEHTVGSSKPSALSSIFDMSAWLRPQANLYNVLRALQNDWNSINPKSYEHKSNKRLCCVFVRKYWIDETFHPYSLRCCRHFLNSMHKLVANRTFSYHSQTMTSTKKITSHSITRYMCVDLTKKRGRHLAEASICTCKNIDLISFDVKLREIGGISNI